MPDGLSDQTRDLILQVFSSMPKIKEVVLYGSRSLGNFRPGSDIDLAIVGDELSYDDLATLAGRLDELPLPYSFDLTLYSRISNPTLREHIDRHGVAFWNRDKNSLGADR